MITRTVGARLDMFDNKPLGKMNVYSFVSRWNRFELLIATFRLQYCKSSSGDEVDCLRVAICRRLEWRCGRSLHSDL